MVRPSSQHQGCSLRLPRVSVVSLLFRAGCDLRGDLESIYGALLATTCLSLDQDRGSSFLSAGCSSQAKATSSIPGTCWSAYRMHLRELGSVSPFCLVRSVTHFRCWPELRAGIVRSAWRNRVVLAGEWSSCSPAAVSLHLQVGGFTQSVVSISARVLHLVLCHVNQCRCGAATI